MHKLAGSFSAQGRLYSIKLFKLNYNVCVVQLYLCWHLVKLEGCVAVP